MSRRNGETTASDVLEREGYSIQDIQDTDWTAFIVEGVKENYDASASYVVERDGRKYVAEVRTSITIVLGPDQPGR